MKKPEPPPPPHTHTHTHTHTHETKTKTLSSEMINILYTSQTYLDAIIGLERKKTLS